MILPTESNTMSSEMRAFLFFITFALFVAVLVWRVDHLMFDDKLAWHEAQSRSQISAIVNALDTEVRSDKDLLSLGLPEIEQAKKDFPSNRPYSRFQMVAKVLPPNLKEDKKDWQISSSFYQIGSASKSWANSYINLLFKNIKPSDVKNGSANLYALLDPQRKAFLVLLSRSGSSFQVGLLGPEALQGLMDRQKGQLSSVYIVNLQGQALGHTTPEYVGSLLTEDPLVGEVMKSSVSSGSGKFKNLKGEEVQGLYEQVEDSNLFAVITTPINSLMRNRNSQLGTLAAMGLGLALIGLAGFVMFDRQTDAPRSKQLRTPLPTPSTASLLTASASMESNDSERMKAYTKVASSLSHELKSPLTSILAHVQLAQSNSTNPEKSQEHLQKIESEARGAREIIQKLLIFAGDDKVTSQKAGLETVVNRALKQVEGKIFSKGIKLQRDIQSVSQFTFSPDLLARAVESLLANAIEAMERVPKKELNVSLSEVEQEIQLSIIDSGEGIASSDISKIFDPFYTTRKGTQHVGLGLSTALGIFKEAFGEMEVHSEKSKGTTVKVIFRPEQSTEDVQAEMIVRNPPSVPAASVSAGESELLLPREKNILPGMEPQTRSGVPARSSLLIDHSIERMIDDADEPEGERLLSTRKSETEDFPPAPPISEEHDFSAKIDRPRFVKNEQPKIDKPKFDIKKKVKTSQIDEMQVSVRKPGSRT